MIYVFIYVVCGLNSDRTYVQYLHTFERFNRRRSAFVITIGLPQVTGSGGAAPLRRGKQSPIFPYFCEFAAFYTYFLCFLSVLCRRSRKYQGYFAQKQAMTLSFSNFKAFLPKLASLRAPMTGMVHA